jgi:hypothetical protein
LTCWKPDLMELGFPPFLVPLLLILFRKMGQNGVPGKLLLCFAPFLLHDILYKNETIYIKMKQIGSVGGEIWQLVVKSGVHAAGN